MNFNLKIVTPEKLFFEGAVDRVVARGVLGEFAILAKHTPFVTQLEICRAAITIDGQTRDFAIAGGYIHVGNNETIIVSDACEFANEIDIKRAQEALNRAEKRINDKNKDYDMRRSEVALKKAINRLNVANQK